MFFQHSKQKNAASEAKTIVGNHNVTTEVRPVTGDFSAICVEGSADINVHQGKAAAVQVTFDENLQECISVAVKGNTLVVATHGSFSSLNGIRVDVTLPTLDAVEINGSGSLYLGSFEGESLDINMCGAGNVFGHGKVNDLAITIAGSGDVKLKDLKAREATITVCGAGFVLAHATECINATVEGAGDIQIYGNPAKRNSRICGAGDIRFR